jgi:hypothetical protein
MLAAGPFMGVARSPHDEADTEQQQEEEDEPEPTRADEDDSQKSPEEKERENHGKGGRLRLGGARVYIRSVMCGRIGPQLVCAQGDTVGIIHNRVNFA